MQKFKSDGSAQRFLSTHAAVYNTFDTQPHLISRPGLRILRAQAHQTWAEACAAAAWRRPGLPLPCLIWLGRLPKILALQTTRSAPVAPCAIGS